MGTATGRHQTWQGQEKVGRPMCLDARGNVGGNKVVMVGRGQLLGGAEIYIV